MKTSTLFAAFTLLAVVAPVGARASGVAPAAPTAMMAVDANKILAEVDKRAASFDDQSYSASMEIFKDGVLKKTLKFSSQMKHPDKQLIVFEAPGDVAGMKVLMENTSNLYLYLPEFKKVRRVAAHVQNQGFLGSTFTYEDMTQVRLSPHFKAELGGKSGNETTLVLTPKQGVESTYPKIEVVIDSTKGGVTQLRYFDGSGALVREQTRSEWIKIEGKLMPTKVSMLNHKTKDLTVITLSDVKVNQGVEDSIFSRRELLRG